MLKCALRHAIKRTSCASEGEEKTSGPFLSNLVVSYVRILDRVCDFLFPSCTSSCWQCYLFLWPFWSFVFRDGCNSLCHDSVLNFSVACILEFFRTRVLLEYWTKKNSVQGMLGLGTWMITKKASKWSCFRVISSLYSLLCRSLRHHLAESVSPVSARNRNA
jgi:hypothetical protein